MTLEERCKFSAILETYVIRNMIRKFANHMANHILYKITENLHVSPRVI